MKRKNLSLLLILSILFATITFIPTVETAAATTKTIAPMIESGSYFTIVLKSDGTVWAWGDNTYGQLGNGTTKRSEVPVQVKNLTGVIKIAVGAEHTIALREDGTLWVWGRNIQGELGFEPRHHINDCSMVPVQIEKASNDNKNIAAGQLITVAVKSNGTVAVWGKWFGAERPAYSKGSSHNPQIIKDLTGVAEVSVVGTLNYIARKTNGTLWAWGENECGVLGLGHKKRTKTPTQIKNLPTFKAIDGGSAHVAALDNDGNVWTWGSNQDSVLGNGTEGSYKDYQSTPKKVASLSGVKKISAGHSHTLALKKDGTVWGCGHNYYGQVGNGSEERGNVASFTKVVNLTSVIDISGGFMHSVAIRDDGTVWMWGDYANKTKDRIYPFNNEPVLRKDANDKTTFSVATITTVSSQTKATYVSLRINKTKAIQNGKKTSVDSSGTKPFKISGRTMIPLRFVGEKMGGTVKYVNDKSPIVLKYGDRMVELRLNSKIITVYQANKGGMTTKYWKETIDVAAQKKNGKTYIPLRAISQALGFKVHYESDLEIIIVSSNSMSSAVKNSRIKEAKNYIK